MKTVTIVDECHGNLVQVHSIVNRTVDLLTVNANMLFDSQVAPPVKPQGVATVVPAKRALTVGRLQGQIAAATSPTNESRAMAVAHAVANHVQAAHSKPIQHTKSDPAYMPFIDNSQK